MLNWTPFWPASEEYRTPAHATTSGDGLLWNPASLLQLQAYFWTQVLDANRNFWSLITAAVPGLPTLPASAKADDVSDAGMEQAAATHAVEDLESVLESQTRFWNHMLDANRNLWSGVTWNLPDVPLAQASAVQAAPPRSTSSAVKRSPAPAARKQAPAKKTQRKH